MPIRWGKTWNFVVRLHRFVKEEKADKQNVYVPDPVSWTEATGIHEILAETAEQMAPRTVREPVDPQKAPVQSEYGSIGMVSMPYFLIIEFLGPVVELTGYLIMIVSLLFGGVYLEFAILLFLLSIFYGSILSMSAVLLEEWTIRKYPKASDITKLFFYSLTETLWYRPLTVLWRCEGIIDFLRKKRGWGEMARKGVSK